MRRKRDIQITLKDLAERLGAEKPAPRFEGVAITGLNDLKSAAASEIAFLTGAQYLEQAQSSQAAAFLAPKGLEIPGDRPILAVADVWKSVYALLDLFTPEESALAGVHPSAVVDPSAQLGANVSIGPLAVVEAGAQIGDNAEIGAQCFIGRDVRIGESGLLHPGVRVLERTEVGRRVILHSGVVLGADGYGYKFIDGQVRKLPQVGNVVIEDDVEIGANTCVDRATFGETRIGAGTKIDNLVQVAHNCRIGKSCGMAAQVGIAGSVETGDFCMLWGAAGIAPQLKIGAGAEIFARSGVKDDVPAGAKVFGYPAGPMGEMARILAAQKQLPEILKRLRSLEKKCQ